MPNADMSAVNGVRAFFSPRKPDSTQTAGMAVI